MDLKYVGAAAKASRARYPGTAKFFLYCKDVMASSIPFGKVSNKDVGMIWQVTLPSEVHKYKTGQRQLSNIHVINEICQSLGITISYAAIVLQEDVQK